MDFVRFTGEWFIYYLLITLGGGVLMRLTAAVLEPAGIDVDRVIEWVLPAGAAGAVIVAAWLVEAKQRVVENMAPVLTMLFTPLFAVMLALSAVVYAATGLGDAFDRDLVSVFDALLVVVLALVQCGMSVRRCRRCGWTATSWSPYRGCSPTDQQGLSRLYTVGRRVLPRSNNTAKPAAVG